MTLHFEFANTSATRKSISQISSSDESIQKAARKFFEKLKSASLFSVEIEAGIFVDVDALEFMDIGCDRTTIHVQAFAQWIDWTYIDTILEAILDHQWEGVYFPAI